MSPQEQSCQIFTILVSTFGPHEAIKTRTRAHISRGAIVRHSARSELSVLV